ncbi:hypothetical protein V1264_006561 [Littorina saxatilis]|uniref:MADF domain-containing protein n=1 Tax=Littorina saxatilis TaxID=31220 RepID=A0AAN9AZH1_9CAEN
MSSKLIWTDERISSLISYYRAEPALWSTKHPSYHNLTARNVAFHRIAEFMGSDITPDMVKTKFETLRGQYTRELLKIKNSKASDSGPDEVYRVRWKFFDQLHFLKNVVSPKAPISNSQPSPPATLKIQQIEEDSERCHRDLGVQCPTTNQQPVVTRINHSLCNPRQRNGEKAKIC